MDIIYVSLFALFVVLFSCSFNFAYSKLKPSVDVKLPPGKRGWPVLGETVEFATTGLRGHPEKFILDRMTKFSQHVFRTSLIRHDTAVFCGPEGNKFLFTNENKLLQNWSPPAARKILPFADQVRMNIKMVRKYFKPDALRQYVPIMDMVTRKHFEIGWEGKDKIMTHELIRNFTFSLACKIFFSTDEPEWVSNLLVPFERISPGIYGFPINLPGTQLRKAINAGAFIRNELAAIIKQRKIDLADGKASPTQDILSQILTIDDDKFNEESEVADLMIGLLIGGHDSASSTCTFIVNYLAELPEIYEGVYKEQMRIAKSKASTKLLTWEDLEKMEYSWKVAREVLRIVSPSQGTFREAITDFTYKGFSIPKGWKLYWSTNSTHKNPDYFPEPEKFDPSRFDNKGPPPYTFVPFGGGSHLCPGKEFVQVEVLVLMHHLVTKFKLKKILANEQIIFSPVAKLAKGLPLRLYPHKP